MTTPTPPSSRGLSSGGGTVAGAVTIQPASAATTPLTLLSPATAVNDTLLVGVENVSVQLLQLTSAGGLYLAVADAAVVTADGGALTIDDVAANPTLVFRVAATGVVTQNGLATRAINSGALPTQAFASGVAAQILTTRDVEAHTPVTFNSTAGAAATCTVALSPDNVTYSTLAVWTEPLGVALAGTILDVAVRVPAGWYLKLTVVNAVLGATTYY